MFLSRRFKNIQDRVQMTSACILYILNIFYVHIFSPLAKWSISLPQVVHQLQGRLTGRCTGGQARPRGPEALPKDFHVASVACDETLGVQRIRRPGETAPHQSGEWGFYSCCIYCWIPKDLMICKKKRFPILMVSHSAMKVKRRFVTKICHTTINTISILHWIFFIQPASRPGILIAISGEGDDQPLDATGCGARAEKSWLWKPTNPTPQGVFQIVEILYPKIWWKFWWNFGDVCFQDMVKNCEILWKMVIFHNVLNLSKWS